MIYSHLDFGLKSTVFSCLTNTIASPTIALESCTRAQTDQPVLWSALEKNFFHWGLPDFLWVTS